MHLQANDGNVGNFGRFMLTLAETDTCYRGMRMTEPIC